MSQAQFDFEKAEAERSLMEQWERNERAQAEQWTMEAMAMHWSGIHHKDHWESLPRYERNRIVDLYQFEQSQLEWSQENWEPVCEVFYPDGHVEMWPQKPFKIRDFREVDNMPSREEMERFEQQVKEMADMLSADWSANRPASVMTYNPLLASAVSLRLGRKVEAIEAPRDADIPISWRLLTGRNKK